MTEEDGGSGSDGLVPTTAGRTSAESGETGDEGNDDGVRFDAATPDLPSCGDASALASYIWISNTSGGTISKVDTRRVEEMARYVSSSVATPDPARTTVNLSGEIAVVDRTWGQVTKFATTRSGCIDRNGNGVIDTSKGRDEVLPWGEDECMLWNVELPLQQSRAAAWTPGEDRGARDECGGVIYEGAKIWTGGVERGGPPIAHVYLLNGDDGTIERDVVIPTFDSFTGMYGAAVDDNGDLWGVEKSPFAKNSPYGLMAHVRLEDFTYDLIELPAVANGFTVDAEARPWIGGIAGDVWRYDPSDDSWLQIPIPTPAMPSLVNGVQDDGMGVTWAVHGSGKPNAVYRIDSGTGDLLETIDEGTLPGVENVLGLSLDVDGMVWLIDQGIDSGNGKAYRVDPSTRDVQTIDGFDYPAAYNDMTGWALRNVVTPAG